MSKTFVDFQGFLADTCIALSVSQPGVATVLGVTTPMEIVSHFRVDILGKYDLNSQLITNGKDRSLVQRARQKCLATRGQFRALAGMVARQTLACVQCYGRSPDAGV